MTQDTTLKPCPFCGSPAEHDSNAGFGRSRHAVLCTKCEACVGCFGSKEGAIAAWNARPAAPEIERLTRERDEAREDRDALLKAIGFTPGPLGADQRRQVILDDARGLRPEMVKARRRALDNECDAALLRAFIDDKPALLLTVWKQRRTAEAEAARLRSALAFTNNAIVMASDYLLWLTEIKGVRLGVVDVVRRVVNEAREALSASPSPVAEVVEAAPVRTVDEYHYTLNGHGIINAVCNMFSHGTFFLGEGDALGPVQEAYVKYKKAWEERDRLAALDTGAQQEGK